MRSLLPRCLGWCDCICPSLIYYEGTQVCKAATLAFLFFGKHGGPLLSEYYLSDLCTKYFCKWIEKISDPRHQVKGAPERCLPQYTALPFKRDQCENLMKQAATNTSGYNPCPWEEPTDEDFIMTCTDGYKCDVRSQTWACCQRHASKARCPRNFPVMCADPLECVGESDHCCLKAS